MQRKLSKILDNYDFQIMGSVCKVRPGSIVVSGIHKIARVGDHVFIMRGTCCVRGEIIKIDEKSADVITFQPTDGIGIGDRVIHKGPLTICPHDQWVGRIIDPLGAAFDQRPIVMGNPRPFISAPPLATKRRGLGDRIETGLPAFSTFLPLVKGQRVGLFSGSGVGKTTLLASLVRHVQADVKIVALIGERGREVRDFVHDTLGEEGMKNTIVIAATSDMSPALRRQCAWTAMCVAEFFRDAGRQVFFIADSITRFAEAHREIALMAGERADLRGFPASTTPMLTALAERAGPGISQTGDITAVLSVLVAGSDMDEPIADIMRGVLDGHIVLDRNIAERGRFPAINIRKSVSRSLPKAATERENQTLSRARGLIAQYEDAELMIQSGLYERGTDPGLEQAIKFHDQVESFLGSGSVPDINTAFSRLELAVRRSEN